MKLLLGLVLLVVAAIYVVTLPKKEVVQGDGDYVVLLHGMMRSDSHMRNLEYAFKEAGYEVINIDYPSTDLSYEGNLGYVRGVMKRELTEDKRVHFVGHSMGGLLVRGLAQDMDRARLGNVVQLGAPSGGSEVADFWHDMYIFKKLYGPSGQELGTETIGAITVRFKPVDFNLGVIAGNCTIDPFSSWIIPGEDDGKVSVESTAVEGMREQIVIPVTHTFFPSNADVIEQTLEFIKRGEFSWNDKK